ncbi:MAG: GIY-YIG nuclease family protein [Chlorobiaceae bacterium]|nr:GIY-YIG nuclease family protein [Chlorobiaceae bacterium]
MKRLFDIGFQVVGHWILTDGILKFQLDRMQNESNVLYAFVVDGDVKYIGKTTQLLNRRMYGYMKPGPKQSTNIKNRANILTLLEKGRVVLILALSDNGLHHYGDFHINLAAGLEDDLIAKLSPEWNGRQNDTLKHNTYQGDLESASVESTNAPALTLVPLVKVPQQSVILPENMMLLTLHKAYFNSGFFNVIVKCQHLFGGDGEEIRIICEDPECEISGYINRSANTNYTPRIMGGVALKRWFQEVSSLNGKVLVEILSPNFIRLKRPE